jgi:hypothetical protein
VRFDLVGNRRKRYRRWEVGVMDRWNPVHPDDMNPNRPWVEECMAHHREGEFVLYTDVQTLENEAAELKLALDQAIEFGEFSFTESGAMYRPDIDAWAREEEYPQLANHLKTKEGGV